MAKQTQTPGPSKTPPATGADARPHPKLAAPVHVVLNRPMPLGNGDRPAGFELCAVALAPDVTIAEVINAFRNPELLTYR